MKSIKKVLFLSLLAAVLQIMAVSEVNAQTVCNVGSPSGSDQTSQIQSAINNCPSGGTVLLEAGATYTAGSIYLKSNTTLKFGSAATTL